MAGKNDGWEFALEAALQAVALLVARVLTKR